MPPGYVTIPRSEYEALVKEAKRGVEVCGEIGDLRLVLRLVADRMGELDPADKTLLEDAIEACADVGRLRVELSALERRLREADQELTPLRPPSRTDIRAAFENSVDFATGKKKPPGAGG